MKAEETYKWLMENGGPVIRYRTATELMPSGRTDVSKLKEAVLKNELVKGYFKQAVPILGINDIHGSKTTAFENIIGKLTDFGLGRGVAELDRYTEPYLKWLRENAVRPLEHIFDMFMRTMVAAFLARAGYSKELSVKKVLLDHLDFVYEFTKNKDYGIFEPGKKKGAKPMIKRELTCDLNMPLPNAYDMVGWGAYLPEYGAKEELLKADNIIEYIMTQDYQGFPPSYDVKVDNSSRSWAMAWNVQLPGFKSSQNYYNCTIHMMNLLANFRMARQHSWFKDTIGKLEEFKTGDGTYLFPREYLLEKTPGYWISGVCMGLEENRRSNKAMEVESTFWMAKFHKALMVLAG
jgi:hypothetical protein